MNKSLLSWIIRVLVSILFIVSAYAKIYHDPSAYFSITTFEAKQLVPLGFSSFFSALLSRFLIALEFSLGLLILTPYYFKKIVLPGTILLLVAFCLHLGIQIMLTGNTGNCGCFGALLPMTPLEAIIKNILAIGLLLALYKLTNFKSNNQKSIYFLIVTYVVFTIFMFLYIPIKNSDVIETSIQIDNPVELTSKGPQKVVSEFGDALPFADQGEVLLCFFAAGCDHCRSTIRAIDSLSQINVDFPKVEIIFMDEEVEKIPEFFEFAGNQYNYRVLDIASFYNVLTWERDTPGVFYMWNGNVLKEFNGTAEKSFDATVLMKIIHENKN
jgi:thiol-disulfide isomerase/thioredoxin